MKVKLLESTDNPDELICKAARNDYMGGFVADQSFEEVMDDIDGEDIEAKKRTLIGHLLDHGHFGPFEHPHATIAVEGISRSCMAQLTRHRHVSFDVQSMRYVSFDEMDPEPGEAVIGIPELGNAEIQGRNAEFSDWVEGCDLSDDDIAEKREEVYREAIETASSAYKELLDLGVAPENARMVLPIGTKVNLVMTLNARMLMHVADMRAAADAQHEIRDLTNRVLDIAEEWAPITFEHYNENLKNRKNRLAP